MPFQIRTEFFSITSQFCVLNFERKQHGSPVNFKNSVGVLVGLVIINVTKYY
jgi:hypothetical protein